MATSSPEWEKSLSIRIIFMSLQKIFPLPNITKYATDSSGDFSTNWKLMSSTQRASLVRYVHEKEPRLEGVFEGEWATDWVLKKLIDQRVADAKRVSAHKISSLLAEMGRTRKAEETFMTNQQKAVRLLETEYKTRLDKIAFIQACAFL